MNISDVKAISIKRELDLLFLDEKRLFENSKYDDEFYKFAEGYGKIKESDQITIVVYGGYSTGKSTIISALTGDRDIQVATDVTTQQADKYEYHGIYLVDTPGIFSDDLYHEKIAKQEMESADIILFCITTELFSEDSKKEFIDIAKKYGTDKVLLCVNKLDKILAPNENSIETIADKLQDLTAALSGSSLSVKMFIFSAKEYIDGADQHNEEKKQCSLFTELINYLNGVDSSVNMVDKCKKQIRYMTDFMEQIKCKRREEETDIDRQRIKQQLDKKLDELHCIWQTAVDIVRNTSELHRETLKTEYMKMIDDGTITRDIVNDMLLQECMDAQEEINGHLRKLNLKIKALTEENGALLDGFDVKLPKGKKNRQGYGAAKKIAGKVNEGAKIISEAAKPVRTRHRWLHPDEFSEIGGKGTKLEGKISKILPKYGEKISVALGKGADFIKNNQSKIDGIVIVGEAVIAVSNIGYSVHISKKKESVQIQLRKLVNNCFVQFTNKKLEGLEKIINELEDNICDEYSINQEDEFGKHFLELYKRCRNLSVIASAG